MGLREKVPRFIAAFIEDREIRVQVGQHISSTKEFENGILQGSVRSVTIIKINGIAIKNSHGSKVSHVTLR